MEAQIPSRVSIHQVESYEKGCLYWIFMFDRYSLSDLHKRLKRLREELSYLEQWKTLAGVF